MTFKKEVKIKVLFVCLGNICRSPIGEGVLRSLVNQAGLSEFFIIDSAGTGGYNIGEAPDPSARRVARRHGVNIDDLRARKFNKEDLAAWNYIIAMDRYNMKNIERLGKASGALLLMREFDPVGPGDVPDPWDMGEEVFVDVYKTIERSCGQLINTIIKEYSLKVMEA
jgi:protein-tyrosine phosphatase